MAVRLGVGVDGSVDLGGHIRKPASVLNSQCCGSIASKILSLLQTGLVNTSLRRSSNNIQESFIRLDHEVKVAAGIEVRRITGEYDAD